MFGLINGGCTLNSAERAAWIGHVCGLCLSLGDNFGQVARLTTNYDAVLLSVLCEAQSTRPLPTVNHICPLRGFRQASVVRKDSAAAQYAASMALLMVATKIQDHVIDRDTWLRFLPGPARRLARRWHEAAGQVAGRLGFQTSIIAGQIQRQFSLEQQSGCDFLLYAQPTEQAVGLAFQHTAALAGCPQNREPLYRLGRMFGRIMYLLDSYRDYAADRAAGKFNALACCYDPHQVQAQAGRLFAEAHREMKRHFEALRLPQPGLARHLLIDQLERTGHHTLTGHSSAASCAAEPPAIGQFQQKRRPPRNRTGSGGWAVCEAPLQVCVCFGQGLDCCVSCCHCGSNSDGGCGGCDGCDGCGDCGR